MWDSDELGHIKGSGKFLCSKDSKNLILSIVQSALHFTSWHTYSIEHHIGFAGYNSGMMQLMREYYLYTHIQMSELEQCRVISFVQGITRQHRIRTRVLLVDNPVLYTLAPGVL